MKASRARHHGPCKHCGKRKRLLPGDPRLCRECVAAAAAWFRGERSVLDNLDVLQASPRLFLQHLIGEALWKRVDDELAQEVIDGDGSGVPGSILRGVDLASCPDETVEASVEVDHRGRFHVLRATRRLQRAAESQGLRCHR